VRKLLWAMVPACVTFGPLAMTRIAGSARTEATYLEGAGVLMLAAGLCVMFRVITRQTREIEALKRDLQARSSGPH
jgi:hypothetical protein